jgi:Tfp pilus assembly protein PilN
MSSDSLTALSRGPFCVVEIGSEWVKVARARHGVVEAVAASPFDSAKGDASAVLRSLVDEHRLTGLPAVALVPRQSVNIRMLELPSQDAAEIRDMVDLQATKQTPYSREEVLVDYRASASDRSGYTHVTLAIVQRSVLRHRYCLLEDAGLKVVQMSVSSEGLLSWARLAVPASEGTVAVLDVDEAGSEVAIVGPAGLLFSRGMQTGADGLNDPAAGLAGRLADEVKRGIDVVRGEMRDLTVGRLVVTGAVRPGGDIVERLSQELGMPCIQRESLSVLRGTQPNIAGPAGRKFSVTALAGAAASPSDLSFNLIPESVLARKTVAVRGRQLAAMAALFLAAMVLGSLAAMVRYADSRERLRRIDEQLSSQKPAVLQTEQRQEIVEVVRRRQQWRDAPLEMLREISRAVPQGVALDSVEINKAQGSIVVAGTAPSMKDIRGLVGSLEQSPIFRDVREGNATTLDKSQRYRFQLVAGAEAVK